MTDAISGEDSALVFVSLRWAKAEDVNRAMYIGRILQSSHIKEGEYYVLVSSGSIFRTVNLLRSNKAIEPFTEKLPWSLNSFYLTRFITSNGLQLSADSEYVHDATGDN